MKSRFLTVAAAVLAVGAITTACTPTRTVKSAGEQIDDSTDHRQSEGGPRA